MFREAVAGHYRAKGYEVRENVKVRGVSGNIHQVALVAEGPLGALVVSFGDAGGMDPSEMGSVRRIAKDVGATPVLAAPAFAPEFRRQAQLHGVVLLDESLQSGGPAFPAGPAAQPAPGSPWPSLQGAATLDRSDLEAHPWPASGLARAPLAAGVAASDVDELVQAWGQRSQAARQPAPPSETAAGAALWSQPRAEVPAPLPSGGRRFAWLGERPAAPHRAASAAGGPAPPDPLSLAAEHASILHTREPGLSAARRRKAVLAEPPLLDRRRAAQIVLYAAATALFVYLLLRLT